MSSIAAKSEGTSTMELLARLGFRPTAVSYGDPTLVFDFGNLKLQACCCLSLSATEIVLFSGVFSTSRTLAEIHFEMPRNVESLRQCATWIVWNLDQQTDGPFKPARPVEWVEEGRANRKLLPWYKSLAEYEARPRCAVERKWLRLALNAFKKHLATLPDDASVVFSFDGSVLSICYGGKLIALAAQGAPWTVRFKVPVAGLRRLPKRLNGEYIDLSISGPHLRLGNWLYAGTAEGFTTIDSSRIQ